MIFFEWLEYSAYAEWVAVSLYAYPIFLSLHAVGLGIVVGTLAVVDLRVAGCFKTMELGPMNKLINLAIFGFVVNLLSGLSLFSAQATYFVTHTAFLIKISAIVLAVINALYLHKMLRLKATDWDAGEPVSLSARLLAISSLLLWSTAMIAGRLIAYT